MEASLIKTIKEFWCSRTNCYLQIFFSDAPCMIVSSTLKALLGIFSWDLYLSDSFELWEKNYINFCVKNFSQAHQKYNLVCALCKLVKSWAKIHSYFKFCICSIWKVSGENCKATFRIFHYILSIQWQVKSSLKGACLLYLTYLTVLEKHIYLTS